MAEELVLLSGIAFSLPQSKATIIFLTVEGIENESFFKWFSHKVPSRKGRMYKFPIQEWVLSGPVNFVSLAQQ